LVLMTLLFQVLPESHLVPESQMVLLDLCSLLIRLILTRQQFLEHLEYLDYLVHPYFPKCLMVLVVLWDPVVLEIQATLAYQVDHWVPAYL